MCRLAMVLFFVAVPVTAAPVPEHLFPKTQPLEYPTKLGTKWVYHERGSTKTLVITQSERKNNETIVTTEWVAADGTRFPHMVRSVRSDGVYLIEEQGTAYAKPWCILKLPVKRGLTWETKLRGRGPDCDGKMTFERWERVKVPAGEFTAARIVWERTVDGGKEPNKTTYWYAHQVGLVQMSERKQLKSFRPAK